MAKRKPQHERDFERMTDQQIIDRFNEDLKKCEAHFGPIHDAMRNYYKLYKSFIPEDQKREGRSNLFVPYTWHSIETLIPKMVNSMFSSRPYATIMPLGVEDDEERKFKANMMQTLLDKQFIKDINIIKLMTRAIRDWRIFGYGVVKSSWKYEKATRKYHKPFEVNGLKIQKVTEIAEKEIILHDRPHLENISVLDYVWDVTCDDPNEARYGIYTYSEDLSTLKSGQIGLLKLKNLKKVTSMAEATEQGVEMASDDPVLTEGRKKREVRIDEYCTPTGRVLIANKSVVIYSGANPYWHNELPFTIVGTPPMTGETVNDSIVRFLEHLQAELNTIRNQRIDSVSMGINRMWKVLKGSGIDQSQLVSRPNGIIEVDEMDDLEELSMSGVDPDAYTEEATVKHDMDQVTGSYDIQRGSSTDRRETATTSSIMLESSGDRFELERKLIEDGSLLRLVNQIISLNQQYITQEVEVFLKNTDASIQRNIVTPEGISGEFEIIGFGTQNDPRVNKEVRQNQLIQLISNMAQNPYVNHAELTRRLFEAFDLRNVDELVQDAPPQPAQTTNQPMQGGPTPVDPMQGGVPVSSGMPEPTLNELLTPEELEILENTDQRMLQLVQESILANQPVPAELEPVANIIRKLMEVAQGEI